MKEKEKEDCCYYLQSLLSDTNVDTFAVITVTIAAYFALV